MRAIIRAILFLLLCTGHASAYTEICTTSDKIYNVKRTIAVPSEKLESFVQSLQGHARQTHYWFWSTKFPKVPLGEVVERPADEIPREGNTIDFYMQKVDAAPAVHITNIGHPTLLVASMGECGSEEFRPYWKEFLQFVQQWENSN